MSSMKSLSTFPLSPSTTVTTVSSDFVDDSFSSAAFDDDSMRSLSTTTSSSFRRQQQGTKEKKSVSFSLSVTFSPVVNARNTISARDFRMKEKRDCWYTSKEQQNIRRRCAKKIKNVQSCGIENLTDLLILHGSIRGLEGYTKKAFEMKTERRRAAYDAVLEVEDPLVDDEYIATKYSMLSSSSQSYANKVALLDQKVVQAYRLDDYLSSMYGDEETNLQKQIKVGDGKLEHTGCLPGVQPCT